MDELAIDEVERMLQGDYKPSTPEDLEIANKLALWKLPKGKYEGLPLCMIRQTHLKYLAKVTLSRGPEQKPMRIAYDTRMRIKLYLKFAIHFGIADVVACKECGTIRQRVHALRGDSAQNQFECVQCGCRERVRYKIFTARGVRNEQRTRRGTQVPTRRTR